VYKFFQTLARLVGICTHQIRKQLGIGGLEISVRMKKKKNAHQPGECVFILTHIGPHTSFEDSEQKSDGKANFFALPLLTPKLVRGSSGHIILTTANQLLVMGKNMAIVQSMI
jgi:hypothetical protein